MQKIVTMKMLLSSVILSIAYKHSVMAARRVDVKKRVTTVLEDFASSTGKRSFHQEELTAKQALGLQTNEDLVEMKRIKTTTGYVKIKYKETFDGIPVSGEGVVLATDKDGHWTGEAHGQLVEGIQDDIRSVSPTLTKETAMQVALKSGNRNLKDVKYDEDEDVSLMVFVRDKRNDTEAVKVQLAYKISYRTVTIKGFSRPFYVIDAMTGEVLRKWEGVTTFPATEKRNQYSDKRVSRETFYSYKNLKRATNDDKGELVYIKGDGGNVRRGRHVFGEDYDKLLVRKIGDTCYLSNNEVDVMGFNLCDYGNTSYMSVPHSFSCYEGNHDFFNSGYSPSNDAFFYSRSSYYLFKNWYGTPPLKFKIKVLVHYANYYNAFWDGEHLILLDGGKWFVPQTEPDIVGHELGHGVTEHNSNLEYRSESGGINEAFSDMAGEALEQYVDNITDLIIGARDHKYKFMPLRFMDDPTRDDRSISHYEDFYEGLDVHLSSGIYNRAFYLLIKDKLWSVRNALHAFFLANQIYWRENTGFHEGACGVLNAAKDLGLKECDIFDVFRRVGVIACPILRKDGCLEALSVTGKRESDQVFVWYALAGTMKARIVLSGGDSDATMVVRYVGNPNTQGDAGTSTTNTGENVIIEFPCPKEGNYLITVRTKRNATLKLAYDYDLLAKELTTGSLLSTDLRYEYQHANNYTYVTRTFSVDSISFNEYLHVWADESTKAKSVYIEIYEGAFKGKHNYESLKSYGQKHVYVCDLEKSTKYHIVVYERIKGIKQKSDLPVSRIYGFSGTKLKRKC